MLTWITKAPFVTTQASYVIIYLMLTWITQTPSYVRLNADLAHPYTYLYLKVICIYADLDYQGPFF